MGLYLWLFQRLSAIFLGIYSIGLIIYCAWHYPINYNVWHALFQTLIMKISTLIVLISVSVHSVIGMWTVITDYVHKKLFRLISYILLMIMMLSYIIGSVYLLWQL